MELKRIEHKLTVCKVAEISNINMKSTFYYNIFMVNTPYSQ